MLTALYVHHRTTSDPSKSKRDINTMKKILEPELKPGGMCNSASGFSAALFINMATTRGLPYRLTAVGGYYSVEILPTTTA